MPEPAVGGFFGDIDAAAVWRFPVRYPGDEGVDAEALLVESDGTGFYLFEKVDAAAARLFATGPGLAPDADNELEVLTVIASPGIAIPLGRMITGADLHPSGDRLFVRVYTMSVEYRLAPDETIAELANVAPTVVAVGPLTEGQGEAIGYSAEGTGLWTVSEGAGAILHAYPCLD